MNKPAKAIDLLENDVDKVGYVLILYLNRLPAVR